MTVKEHPYPEEVGRVMYEKDLNAHHSGIRLLEVRQGFAIVSMSIERRMLNGHGICHGGFSSIWLTRLSPMPAIPGT